jgi:pimeloyl-ACP methyl ester carboxylesterase
LRVDDRGVGGSTGDISRATSEDFAGDVLAGIEYLKTRKEINPKQIGLIGHSEGGLIAPMVAVQSPDVAFIILMAGTGLTGEEILYLQAALIARAAGAAEETIAINRKIQQQMFNIAKQQTDDAVAEVQIQKALNELLAELPQDQKKVFEAALEAQKGQIKSVLNPWFRFFISYDPKPTLSKVKCPVLAINGEKDLQVPPKENLQAIEQALKAGGHKDFVVKELPSLNHLFQLAQTGAPSEYSSIEETISPLALKTISDWIQQQIKM